MEKYHIHVTIRQCSVCKKQALEVIREGGKITQIECLLCGYKPKQQIN
jgi:Zn ribbon nucleic-acid-binding protein